MNVLVTKERPISNEKRLNAHERFHRALEAAATGEQFDFGPADENEDLRLRVLIVDDQRANADTLALLVAKWGHNVRRAYDGITGLALAAACPPDVLLLDILMPNVSGFEVASQARRQDRLKHCFIVAITGRTDAEHRSQCYEAGVDLYLIKPVEPANMQTLLSLESQRVKRLNHVATMARSCSGFVASY